MKKKINILLSLLVCTGCSFNEGIIDYVPLERMFFDVKVDGLPSYYFENNDFQIFYDTESISLFFDDEKFKIGEEFQNQISNLNENNFFETNYLILFVTSLLGYPTILVENNQNEIIYHLYSSDSLASVTWNDIIFTSINKNEIDLNKFVSYDIQVEILSVDEYRQLREEYFSN